MLSPDDATTSHSTNPATWAYFFFRRPSVPAVRITRVYVAAALCVIVLLHSSSVSYKPLHYPRRLKYTAYLE